MKIGVIGGGASGMMAAITAATYGAKVVLLEKNDRIGRKILATGNGKCNFSNKTIEKSDYNSQKNNIFEDYISRFDEKQVISFFQNEGMLIKEKNGYYYPRSEQASTVLDVLRAKLQEKKVEIITGCCPLSLKAGRDKAKKEGFEVILEDKSKLFFERLILACGSFAGERSPVQEGPTGYRYAQSFGHSIVPVVPALVQLKAKDGVFKSIAGVRCEAVVTLFVAGEKRAREQGELQLTDYGISGIPVFQLSRIAAYGFYEKKEVFAVIDFLPEYSTEEWAGLVEGKLKHCHEGMAVEEFFLGFLNKKLNHMFIRQAGLKPEALVKSYDRKRILQACLEMKGWKVQLKATNPFVNAQVCAGGVSMKEISLHMESKKIKGLFFAGEMLDVDGRCGGYNLQWAWTSGYLAGKYASMV